MTKTDADVRERLREAAFKAVRILEIAMGEIDSRDPEMAPFLDAKDLHRMQRAAESAIAAWARTVEAKPVETGAVTPAMLTEAVAGLFRDRHPQVLEAARLAGVAIVPVLDTTGEEANASQAKR